jgi:predicted acyl esterase
MYGKSYDGVTGLIGEVLQPKGLAAVVAQEPVYDMYRYLYANGIRYLNSVATPMLYNGIEATPGTIEDDPDYQVNGANNSERPGCEAGNWADQQDSNHESDYWKARDLISKAKNGKTPLFMTQGFLENNTKPDGAWDFFNAVDAPKRGWFGMFDHVRGNDRDESGRLAMGREGWFDEVMRFYDQHLRGTAPSVTDPALAIQTSDGTWRAEEQWPPADARRITVPLNSGEYVDNTNVRGTGDGLGRGSAGVGVWTISPPLPHDAHFAGVPRVTVDLETQAPNANFVVNVYDIDADNQAVLIDRQAHLVASSGELSFDLYGNDWKLPAGHRIGILLTTSNNEWWQLAVPTNQTVTVNGGTLSLPFLTYARRDRIQGERAIRLDNYMANAPFELPEERIAEGESGSFPFPPPLSDRPVPGAGAGSAPAVAAPVAAARKATGTRRRAARARLRARISRRGRRLVVTGRAKSGTRVTVRLLRGRRTVVLKRVRARRGAFRAVFRLPRPGLYRAVVTARVEGQGLRARTRLVRVRR